MSPKEIRQYASEQVRGVDRESRTVDIIASDFSIDSYGTRIDPNGWDLDQFRKNPVICLQHDSSGSRTDANGLPIARALSETVRVENGKLLMRIQFPEAGKFPLADQVFELVADGFLRGVSVGFDPVERESVEESGTDGYKQQVTIYRKQKLMETSLVTIPSNDNAVVVRSAKLNTDAGAVRQKIEKLEEGLKSGGDDAIARFVELARTVGLDPADHEKCKEELTKRFSYFDKKQPANKAATGVLKRFFDKAGEKQPDDEVKAWERMAEIVEQTDLKIKEDEQPKVEEKKEETPAAPAPTPPTVSKAPEAPAPVQKASVLITVAALRALPNTLAEAMTKTASEALMRGVPRSEIGGLLDDVAKGLKSSLIHQ